MDTNVLQNILEKLIINDDLTLYVFDVINDRVDKYSVLLGEVTKEKTDTMQNYLDNIKDLEFDKSILKKEKDNTDNNTLELQEQIDKLNNKKKETLKLFTTDEIDYETFNEIKNVINEKLEVLKNELNSSNKEKDVEESTNVEVIKEIVVNLKNNFLHLDNHEKKMFLERFVKEIKVRKEDNDVIIDEVIF